MSDDGFTLTWGMIRSALPEPLRTFAIAIAGMGTIASSETIQDLLRDPSSFILYQVFEWIVGGILGIVEPLIAWLLLSFGIVIDAVVDAGIAVLGSLGTVGDIPLNLLSDIGQLLNNLANMLGPASPIAAVAVWAVVVLLFALAIRFVLEVIQWI